jgi:hypothetical protein
MAKVEGSNPFIRFKREPCKSQGFSLRRAEWEQPQFAVGTTHGYQTGVSPQRSLLVPSSNIRSMRLTDCQGSAGDC